MLRLKVDILRVTDTHQPGWVECQLIDAVGTSHRFVEKIPVVSENDLSIISCFPCTGYIQCVLKEKTTSPEGRVLWAIDTTEPDGIESLEGKSNFLVKPEQIDGLNE